MDNLFSLDSKKYSPLAERMRPEALDKFIGQKHILNPNAPLYKVIKNSSVPSCIFYGAPGTGKTTLANIIAKSSNSQFFKLNAISSGVADVKNVIEQGKQALEMYGKRTYLLLDECHRFNKTQLDSLLEAIEKGYIIFIGSTTENPNVALTRALLSRCQIFEFKPLTKSDILEALEMVLKDKDNGYGNQKIEIDEKAKNTLFDLCGGDLRAMYNILEYSVLSSQTFDNKGIKITSEILLQCSNQKSVAIDENIYYNLLSAFCKSLRGSDSDAAIFYAMRLIDAGCDPTIIIRRVIAHASEDVGMADSMAMVVAVSAMQALKTIGMPEALLNISHAIIYVCNAPKSNSVYLAMHSAMEDAKGGKHDDLPVYLKDSTYAPKSETSQYKYPHDFGGWVEQQYLPHSIKDKKYYFPTQNGAEKEIYDKNKK